ncbi:hypothetical protein FOZ62_003497 [Perkinsus olseni]|uniref:Uncharacterized protein n=1 Tax=Perkinsus olseni TaxID=32597 RepID=A0A7J6UCC5_PEROL|nr:hypothetical protein FOZ62_003497 [Perkinsus olseni]
MFLHQRQLPSILWSADVSAVRGFRPQPFGEALQSRLEEMKNRQEVEENAEVLGDDGEPLPTVRRRIFKFGFGGSSRLMLPGSGSGLPEQLLASVAEMGRNAATVVRGAFVSIEKGTTHDGLGSSLFPVGEEEKNILAHGQPTGYKVKMDTRGAEDGSSSSSLVVSGFDTGCMVMVEVECAEASYKGRALLSEGPMEMDAATRRTLDNIIAAGGTRFQVQMIGDDGGEVDAMLQVMSNGVRLTVTAPRNSYEPMECCYWGEYPEVRIYPAGHASRFGVITGEGDRWKLRALSRQARDLAVLTIRSLKGLQLYGNSRALVEGELGEGGGRLVMLLEMERLRTKVAGLVGEAERMRKQFRKAVAEKQTLADQLTDTIEAYTQVMESGSSGFSEAYRPAITEDVCVMEEVETLRLSNRRLTAEVKTLRAEILRMKVREFAAEKAASQEASQSKNGCTVVPDIEETQVVQDAQVRKLEQRRSLLEEERDRLKEELQQLSEMYLELWSKRCSPEDGLVVEELKREVTRLKEANGSLTSRVRKLVARSEAPPEPDELPEGI